MLKLLEPMMLSLLNKPVAISSSFLSNLFRDGSGVYSASGSSEFPAFRLLTYRQHKIAKTRSMNVETDPTVARIDKVFLVDRCEPS